MTANIDVVLSEQPAWTSVNGGAPCSSAQKLSVFDRGLMYGDSVYTTLKINDGKPLFLKRHIDRLQHDSDHLGYDLSVERLDLPATAHQLIKAGEISHGYLRIQITRGERLNFPDLRAIAPTWICTADRSTLSPPVPISTITGADIRDKFKYLKTSNRIGALIALREANQHRAGEFIFTDGDELVEGTCHNLFCRTDNGLITPELGNRGLPGIIRQVLIDSGLAFLGDIPKSVDCPLFLTNCLVGAVPVSEIDGRPLKIDWNFLEEILNAIKENAAKEF